MPDAATDGMVISIRGMLLRAILVLTKILAVNLVLGGSIAVFLQVLVLLTA